jgi:hypothetical protein
VSYPFSDQHFSQPASASGFPAEPERSLRNRQQNVSMARDLANSNRRGLTEYGGSVSLSQHPRFSIRNGTGLSVAISLARSPSIVGILASGARTGHLPLIRRTFHVPVVSTSELICHYIGLEGRSDRTRANQER